MGASDETVLTTLGVLVRDQGWDVTGDPARLRGMLSDLLGAGVDDHRGLVDALVVSAEEGVPDAVRAAGPQNLASVRGDLIAELEDWGLTPSRAAWVIEAWSRLAPPPTAPAPATAAPETVHPEPVIPEPATAAPPAGEPTVLPRDPHHATAADPPVTAMPEPEVDPVPIPVPEVVHTALPVPPVEATALPVSPPLTALPPDEAAAAPVEPQAGDRDATADGPATSTDGARRAPPTRTLVVALVATVALTGGGVAGARALSGGDEPPPRSEPTATRPATSPGASAQTSPAAEETVKDRPSRSRAARGDELMAAPRLRPEPAPATYAMAARAGGVRVAAMSDVDQVGSGAAAMAPPEGGRLIAFRLADWRCDVTPCQPWSKLDLDVVVGKDVRRLPSGDGTFVVAVPRRDMPVVLRMRSDGFVQSVSLRDGRPGRDNISVLARGARTAELGRSFSLTENHSAALLWPNGVVSSAATRDVTVRSAELGFFGYARRPGSPDRAILAVDAFYTRPWDASPAAFRLAEMSFRAADGTRYEAIDINPDPAKIRPGFEVPADLQRGTIVLGGPTPVAVSTGTLTLSPREVPVRFS